MSKTYSASELIEGVKAGDRSLLAQAITLVESQKEEHHALAEEVVDACLKLAGNSIRIGITGVPGVGKSTFIEAFGTHLCEQGKNVAVLAVDPSSTKTSGSILGDKTRMQELSTNPKAFVRPSPSAGALGGVAATTRESITVCEAAGFDVIIVETVGVGQSETAVNQMVDFFLLLMLTGAGDELQGIKRGIMEMANAVVINKADGDNVERAKKAAVELKNALHLFPEDESGWTPPVLTCSSLAGTGVPEIWKLVEEFEQAMTTSGYFQTQREEQAKHWLHECINYQLMHNLLSQAHIQKQVNELEQEVMKGALSPSFAAKRLLLDNS